MSDNFQVYGDSLSRGRLITNNETKNDKYLNQNIYVFLLLFPAIIYEIHL